ncbi:MAG: PHP domain-containing protein [Peptococcia bacterium]
MKEWSLDLHIHSVLSPCCSEEMLPPAVIGRAKELGLEALAITDHNSGANAQSFIEKGQELGVKVFPGMELQTAEDIHLVCLFEDISCLMQMQELVYQKLPPLRNNRQSIGEQWLVDKEGKKIGELEQLLLVGTTLTIEEAVRQVHRIGGLCLAAHLDRQAFSLWGYLGAIPADLELDGVELTPHLARDQDLLEAIKERGFSYITSSDAHYLADIRPPQCFARMTELSLSEIRKAMLGQDGRQIRLNR